MTTHAAFWDRIAEKYAASPISDQDAYHYTLDRIRSYLHGTDTVLELGCGTGSTALLLAPSVAHYVASDISENMLTIGRRNALEKDIKNVEFHSADAGLPTGTGPDL